MRIDSPNVKGRLIVFEGISGAGKTTIINELSKLPEYTDSLSTNWFSLKKFREIASEINQYEKLTPEMYSLIYALEFYARYELQIYPYYNNGKTILAHRYIYTPFAHDTVRGSKESFLDFLYCKEIVQPDIVFFIDVSPELAFKRISSVRKPTFFECGLDIEYSRQLNEGFKRYNNGFFSDKELENRFMNYQNKVYSNYQKILFDSNVVLIEGILPIHKQKEAILERIK